VERKQTWASTARWKVSGDKTQHKLMRKYAGFQSVNIIPQRRLAPFDAPNDFIPILRSQSCFVGVFLPISSGKEKRQIEVTSKQALATRRPQK